MMQFVTFIASSAPLGGVTGDCAPKAREVSAA